MNYDDYTILTADEYENACVAPLRDLLYNAVLSYHGQMYEEGYTGYPGSSQSLNIDNPFDRVTDELTRYALELLDQEDLGLLVRIQ